MKYIQVILSLAVAAAISGCDNAPLPTNSPAASTPPVAIGTDSASPSPAGYTPGYANNVANPNGVAFGTPQPPVLLPDDAARSAPDLENSGDPWPPGYIPQIVVAGNSAAEAAPEAAATQAESPPATEAYTPPAIPYYDPGIASEPVYVQVPTYIEYAPPVIYEPVYYPYPVFGGVIVVYRYPHWGDHDGHGHNGWGGWNNAPGPIVLPSRPARGGGEEREGAGQITR